MRTTVTLDSRLVTSVKKISNAKTKARAVVIAIQDYLRRHEVAKIKSLKGKLCFDLSAAQIRHAQR